MSGNVGAESVNESSRLTNCNFCKAALMIIIVLYHSGIFSNGIHNAVGPNDMLGTFLKWLATFHNYAFVLISGYIYCYIKTEREGYKSFRGFISKKAKRLLIPFFIVGYLWVFPIRAKFLDYTAQQIIYNFVLGINPGQLWFLFMLFWVFVYSHIIYRYFSNNMFYTALIVLAVFYAGMILGNHIPNVFQVFTGTYYLPYFFAGFCMRKYEVKICRIENLMLAMAIVCNLAIFFLSYSISHQGLFGTLMTLIGLPVMRLSGAIMAFLILDRLAHIIPWNNKFGRFLCTASFPIYLFHEQIIYFFAPYLGESFGPIISMISVFIIAMVITSILSGILMKRPFTKAILGLS
mgnify:CR=1 FL=1